MRIVNRDDDQLPENSCQISKRQVDNWTRLEIFNGIMNRLKLFKYQTIFNYRFTCIYEIIEKKTKNYLLRTKIYRKIILQKRKVPLCTIFCTKLVQFFEKIKFKNT